jgi:uncharacterized protein YejL (UPF0352 family)
MQKKNPCMTVAEFSKLGNLARNKVLSAEQRKAIAKRAAKARWSKVKEK